MKRSPEEYEAARKAAIARETAVADQILRDGVRARKSKAAAERAKDSPTFFHLHAVALHAKQLLGPNADALAAARAVEARYYPRGRVGRLVGALRRAFARLICVVIGHLAYICRTKAPLGCEGKDCGEFLEFVEACASCGHVRHETEPGRAGITRMRKRGAWAGKLTAKALDAPSLDLANTVEKFDGGWAEARKLAPPRPLGVDELVDSVVAQVPPWHRAPRKKTLTPRVKS